MYHPTLTSNHCRTSWISSRGKVLEFSWMHWIWFAWLGFVQIWPKLVVGWSVTTWPGVTLQKCSHSFFILSILADLDLTSRFSAFKILNRLPPCAVLWCFFAFLWRGKFNYRTSSRPVSSGTICLQIPHSWYFGNDKPLSKYSYTKSSQVSFKSG